MLYEVGQINRTKWNYKTYNAGSQWGVFNKKVSRIDIKTASYEEIIDFILEIAPTEAFEFNDVEMSKII